MLSAMLADQLRATSWPHGRLALATVLFSVLLAGCGGSSGNGTASKSAPEILAASKAAVESATSVRVSGGSAQGPLKLTINLQLASNAGHAQVSLLGLEFEVIRTGGTLYLKGGPAFYRRLGITMNVPPGAWVAISNPSQAAGLDAFTDLQGEVNRVLSTSTPPTKGASTTITGQPAIELKISGKLYSGSLYIATTGQPYPLQLTKSGKETSHITFSGWDQPVTIAAPTNVIAFK